MIFFAPKPVYPVMPVLFCLLFCARVSAQMEVGAVLMDGLKRCDQDLLRTYFALEKGDSVSMTEVERGICALKRLPVLANCEMQLDTLPSGQVVINIQANEAQTFYPVIQAGNFRDDLWITLGFREWNAHGKGIQYNVLYRYANEKHGFELGATLPRIKNKPWGVGAAVNNWSSNEFVRKNNEILTFDYHFVSAHLDIIRWVGTRHRIMGSIAYFDEEYEPVSRSTEVNAQNTNAAYTLACGLGRVKWDYNAVVYDYQYRQGFKQTLTLQTDLTARLGERKGLLQWDAYYYQRIARKGNLASHFRYGTAANYSNTLFAPFILDNYVNLRGIGDRIERGTGQMVYNVEYRQTVWEHPKRAIQVVGFVDGGFWRTPGLSLEDMFQTNQHKQVAGLGLRYINKRKFEGDLRLDYTLYSNNNAMKGLAFGLGQFF